MPVISRRYSTTGGASLPPSGTYRSSALDRSYCNTTSNSYITPRVTTHTRISSTFDSYRFEEPKKTTSISTYQKYSKGLDTTDSSRYRRSDSRNRETTLSDSGYSRNDAAYNRMMATSAADIINKYSPANYVPKCDLIRSRSLSDPRNVKEKSQVNCSICQTKVTPQLNALSVPCNNTKCVNINKTNTSEGLSVLSTTKLNSFDYTNSATKTKTKPIYRTIPEPNRNSAKVSNVTRAKKANIEKLSLKDENIISNKVKKSLAGKRRFSNVTENKIESCPDIRQWPANIDLNINTDIRQASTASHSESKKTSHKTKETTDKSENTSVSKPSVNTQRDNIVKRNKTNITKVHNNIESDNNGNKLVNSVAEIRKKFAQQSQNSSYVVWTNLGKNRKLPNKTNTENITTGNGSLRKHFKSDDKNVKNIDSHDKSVKVQKTNCQESNVKIESLESNVTLNKDLVPNGGCLGTQNTHEHDVKLTNNNKQDQILQLPGNDPHGDIDKRITDKEIKSTLNTHINDIHLDAKDSHKQTLAIKDNDVKCNAKHNIKTECANKPKQININAIQDPYVIKRSPTNHTSDIPSYIPINQPINSSIFDEQKVDDIKFIDSELDYSFDEDLNSNIRGNSCDGKAEMNNYDNVITNSENMNHKNSAQGTIKRIGVDNSVPSTSRRTYQTEQSYIAEPTRDRLSTIRSSIPSSTNSRSSSVEQDNKNVAGLNGLRNIGNTCFMNSVLQCLSNTRLLTEYLKKDSCSGEIGSGGALIKAFSTLIGELWGPGSSRVVNTSVLKTQVQKIAPRFMGYAQQDAQEFLRYLLEGLHEDINRVKTKPRGITTEIDDNLSDSQKSAEAWARYIRSEDSHIVDLFVGQLKSTLKCTICGHSSVTFDPFWDLSLPIPSRVGQLRLNQCLDLFTKEEILDGDEKPTCSKCQVRRKCTKRFSIQKFPKILVIHLKRFSPTERFRGKLNSLIDFPLTELDLSSYAANPGTPCIYDLYAVSNHSGTTYSGHYTAYCKHPYTHEWHEYNDSRVSSISARSIVSNEAYVLFYELSNHQTSHL